MLTVFVRGLEFYGFHGVPDAEQAVGHRYVADVSVTLEAPAAESDDIKQTVDYGALAGILLKLSHERRFRTLEAFAATYAQIVLEALPPVQEVEVELAKRLPPVPVVAEAAGVRLALRREPPRRNDAASDIV